MSMTHDTTLGAFPNILPAPRQDMTTVAAPFRTTIRNWLETVRDAMVEFVFIVDRIATLGDTLSHHLLVTFLVTQEAAVLTLIPSVTQKFPTKRTAHNVVELFLNELMAVLLENLFLLLTDSAMTAQSAHERRFGRHLRLLERQTDQNLTYRLEIDPCRNQYVFDILCRGSCLVDNGVSVKS